jgi:hypothetical protein
MAWHRWRVVLLGSLIFLLAAEFGVRLLAGGPLRDPVVWENEEANHRWHQLRRLGRAGGASTVFVGSSLVGVGVDPKAYTSLSGTDRPAYNAALLGSSIGQQSQWVREFVVPLVRPDVVVIGISGRELNDANVALDRKDAGFANARPVRARRGELSLLEEIDGGLRDASYLFRYREVLRRPATAFDDTPLPSDSAVTDLGMTTAALDRQFTPAARTRVARGVERARRFAFDEGSLRQLRELLAWLEARGIEAVVVDMPQTEAGLAYFLNGATDRATWSGRVAAVAAETGAQFVEPGTWELEYFADEWHLNGRGAARLTPFLAGALKH